MAARILVVDDDPDLLGLLRLQLSTAGCATRPVRADRLLALVARQVPGDAPPPG